MTTPQQAPAAQPAAPAPAQPATTTLDQRAAQVAAELRGEPSESAAEAPAAASSPASAADSAAPDAEKIRAERRARLDALNEATRKRVDDKERQAAVDKASRELEQLRKEAAEAKARAGSLIDPKSLDERKFFELAQSLEIPPSKLADYIRESLANPERVAAASAIEAAKKAVDPEVAALKKEIAALQEAQRERDARASKAQVEATENQAAREFFKLTEERGSTAPHSLTFLKKKGPDAYYQLAYAAAQSVPEGAGLDAVLDLVETRLEEFASIYGHTADPSQGQALPKPRAAAKANTVSNQLAASRESLPEEEDFSRYSLDERAARLKAQFAK